MLFTFIHFVRFKNVTDKIQYKHNNYSLFIVKSIVDCVIYFTFPMPFSLTLLTLLAGLFHNVMSFSFYLVLLLVMILNYSYPIQNAIIVTLILHHTVIIKHYKQNIIKYCDLSCDNEDRTPFGVCTLAKIHFLNLKKYFTPQLMNMFLKLVCTI